MFSSVFDIVFWVSLALAIISLIVAVALFFKDKIWLVFQYFNGVKSGKRMAGRVQMQTSAAASAAKPKPAARGKAKAKADPVTVQLKGDPATVQLRPQPSAPQAQADPATVHLAQPQGDPVTVQLPQTQGTAVPGGTAVMSSDEVIWSAPFDPGATAAITDADAGATMAMAGSDLGATAVMPAAPAAAPAPASAQHLGSVPMDFAPAPEGGTMVLRDNPPAPAAAPGGTVILTGDGSASFRVTERIMFVFSDEVEL